jgi:probable F420-dependent oxidoreductase
MKYWYSLAFTPMDQLVELAQAAEECGFVGVGLAHHMVTPDVMGSDYPYSDDGTIFWDPATPFPDPIVAAAALAQYTKRIKFATSILILPLLEPLTVANAVATAAILSQGRFILGVGVGWLKAEFDIVQVDYSSRGRRMDEMIQVIRLLLTGNMVEHHGEFFDFPAVQLSPVPNEPLPIYGAGHSDHAFRRTAQLDGWLSSGPFAPDEAEVVLKRLQEARKDAGTLDKPFDCTISVMTPGDQEIFDRMESLGADAAWMLPPSYFGGDPNPSVQERLKDMQSFSRRFIH